MNRIRDRTNKALEVINTYQPLTERIKNIMELTIYGKTRTTADGKAFTSYISTLTKNTGEELTVSVKFRESAGLPPKKEDCPCNIIVEKSDCNLARRNYTDKNGNPATSYTLWVTKFENGAPFVDHSLDDFI